VLSNSNTELLPIQAQNSFYRMSNTHWPNNVRVTGYGIDFSPPGTVPNNCNSGTQACNADSRTLQTHSGSLLGLNILPPPAVYWEYTVDTEGANSGSPVISTASGFTNTTIGIHTDGGCNLPNDGNRGTSFDHSFLGTVIQNFPDSNTIYVDKNHPIVTETGNVFTPYDTIVEAVNSASGTPVISIVAGSYNETMTINSPMILTAPAGTVTIGQ
jgi:hypothetical protein